MLGTLYVQKTHVNVISMNIKPAPKIEIKIAVIQAVVLFRFPKLAPIVPKTIPAYPIQIVYEIPVGFPMDNKNMIKPGINPAKSPISSQFII